MRKLWAVCSIVIVLAGCATIQTYTAADFQKTKLQIRRIAILPFANETPVPQAEQTIRGDIASALLEEGARRPDLPEIISIEQVDKALYEQKRLSFESAIDQPLSVYNDLWNVDAVLVGQVSNYHEPTSEERLGSLMWNAGQAEAVARANLQLYRCQDEQLLWQREVVGVDHPWLAIQGAFTSAKGAERGLIADLKRNWPWISSKSREDR